MYIILGYRSRFKFKVNIKFKIEDNDLRLRLNGEFYQRLNAII
jgi:hypothetical protein